MPPGIYDALIKRYSRQIASYNAQIKVLTRHANAETNEAPPLDAGLGTRIVYRCVRFQRKLFTRPRIWWRIHHRKLSKLFNVIFPIFVFVQLWWNIRMMSDVKLNNMVKPCIPPNEVHLIIRELCLYGHVSPGNPIPQASYALQDRFTRLEPHPASDRALPSSSQIPDALYVSRNPANNSSMLKGKDTRNSDLPWYNCTGSRAWQKQKLERLWRWDD